MQAETCISTIAGKSTLGFSGDGGLAQEAELFMPMGLAIDKEGNLLVADHLNHRIRRIEPNGMISSIAGRNSDPTKPQERFSGDGGPASEALLWGPMGLVADNDRNLFFVDSLNNRIRQIRSDGVIQTIDLSAVHPMGLARDQSGALYFSEMGLRDEMPLFQKLVEKEGEGWTATPLAGGQRKGFSGDGGLAVSAQFNVYNDGALGLAVDPEGNLYIADTNNHRIRRVGVDGMVTTIAGTGVAGFSGDGGSPTLAQLNRPTGLAFDSEGDLFVADSWNARIRKITFKPEPMIATYVGSGEVGIGSQTIEKITIEYPMGGGFGGDGGSADQAKLMLPTGIGFDSEDTLYIADYSRIRKVTRAKDCAHGIGSGAGTPPSSGEIINIFSQKGSPSSFKEGTSEETGKSKPPRASGGCMKK